ncbi:hypothetical protein ACFLQN_03245 [Candidatus Aenigmatarchaeota archaeon]
MKKIIISTGLIVLFAMAVIVVIIYNQNDNQLNPYELVGMTTEEAIIYIQEKQSIESSSYLLMIPLMSFVGVLIGLIVFYIMSLDITTEKKKDDKLHKNLLKFLPSDERIVVQMLLENDGKVNQYEVTRLPEMNKVKSHRVIDKLLKRGIIKKEKIGKINRIVLVD